MRALVCQFTHGLRCVTNHVQLTAFDNAMAESFFATLECELIDREHFRTREEARTTLFDYLEPWYNPRRRHSALDYASLVEYERRCQEAIGALSN